MSKRLQREAHLWADAGGISSSYTPVRPSAVEEEGEEEKRLPRYFYADVVTVPTGGGNGDDTRGMPNRPEPEGGAGERNMYCNIFQIIFFEIRPI